MITLNKSIISGIVGDFRGVPVFEDKNIPEGTYCCLDRDNIPIKRKDFKTKKMAKLVVHNYAAFILAMNQKNNKIYDLIKRTVGGGDHEDWFIELEEGIKDIVDQAILQERKKIVEEINKLKFSPKAISKAYWHTRGDFPVKNQVYWEAMKDVLKFVETNQKES